MEISDKLKEKIEFSNWLIESQEGRVKLQKDMLKTYLLNWEFPHAKDAGNEWVVPTVDPLPNNAIRTMANILANKQPRIKVKIPRESVESTLIDRNSALGAAIWRRLPLPVRRMFMPQSNIEKMQESYENVIRYAFKQNDERRDVLRKQSAMDGFIYDQIVHKVVDLRMTGLWQGKAYVNDGMCPIIFVRIDPTTFYSDRNDRGLSFVLHRYQRPVREINAVYKDRIRGKSLDDLKDDQGFAVFNEMWWCDADGFEKTAFIEKIGETYESIEAQIEGAAWIVTDDGKDIEENTLGFIPLSVRTCNGTGNEIMPTLYAAVKSGMVVASNIAWTYRASLPIKFANPQAQLEGWDGAEKLPNLGYDGSRVIGVKENQKLSWLEPPHSSEIPALLETTEHKMQESLISETMMGRYPSGAPASAFALATATGAQIVEPVREALKYTFSQDAQMEFKFLRQYPNYSEDEGKLTLWIEDKQTVVDPAQIPQWMNIDVDFEPDLPQDKIALMNIAMAAYKMQWLPRDKTYEIAKLEDVNEINAMWDKQGQQPQRQQQPQQLPAQALPPNVQQGFPIEQNPEALNPMEQMQNAVQNPMGGMMK